MIAVSGAGSRGRLGRPGVFVTSARGLGFDKLKLFDISGNRRLRHAESAFRQFFRQSVLGFDFVLADYFQDFILSGISHIVQPLMVNSVMNNYLCSIIIIPFFNIF